MRPITSSLLASLMIAVAMVASAQHVPTIGDAVYASHNLPVGQTELVLGELVRIGSEVEPMDVTSPPSGMPGDVNGDGVVDVADVQILLRLVVGLQNQPNDEKVRAFGDIAPHVQTSELGGPLPAVFDAVGDGYISIGDVVAILRQAIGLERNVWPERTASIALPGPKTFQGVVIRLWIPDYARLGGGTWVSPFGGTTSMSNDDPWYTAFAVLWIGDVTFNAGEVFATYTWKGPRSLPYTSLEIADSSGDTVYLGDPCNLEVVVTTDWSADAINCSERG